MLGRESASTAANQLVIGSNSYGVTTGYLGNGVTAASPSGFTLNATGGSGTNIAGASLTFAGGRATGNAAGGDIIFQTSDAGASGTTLQTLTAKMTLTETGNLGIATTSPWGLLSVNPNGITGPAFVVGSSTQCVTGDTRLRRRKRRRGKNGALTDDYDYDEVQIKDAQEGDEIASLDERTGAIVWSRVNALMDMGVKQTYKLTTTDGRVIRTTGNHPYLVRDLKERAAKHASPIAGAGWLPVSDIAEGDYIAAPKPRLGVFIDDANMFYGRRKAGMTLDWQAIHDELATRFDIVAMRYHLTVPRESDSSAFGKTQAFVRTLPACLALCEKPLKYIRATRPDGTPDVEKKGDVDMEIAVDVWRHIEHLDAVLIFAGDSDYVALRDEILRRGRKVAFASFDQTISWEIRAQAHLLFDKIAVGNRTQNKAPSAGLGVLSHHLWYSPASMLSSRDKDGSVESGMAWVQVSAIEPVAEEQVFDIEVADTHNFIGNDIVAHNTYLTVTNGGNVGIGTTSPWTKLAIEATAGSESFSIGSSTATHFLVNKDGNVGVGTAAPTQLLHIAGSTSRGLFNSGHAAFGSSGAIATNKLIDVRETYSNTSGTQTGLYSDVTFDTAGSQGISGIWGEARLTASSGTYTNAATGVYGEALADGAGGTVTFLMGMLTLANARSAVSVTNAYGIYNQIAKGAGTITNAYGMYYLNIPNANIDTGVTTGTVTNQYGIGITNLTRGTSRNVGILLDDGTVGASPTGNFGILQESTYVNSLAGNVGIGTTSPAQLLSVSGNGYLTGGLGIGQTETTAGNITGTGRLSITSTSATSTFSTGGLTVGTSQFVVQQTSGNVGIGTTGPDEKTHIFVASAGTVTANTNTDLIIENNANTGINFLTPNTATQFILFGDPDNTGIGRITYDHNVDLMGFYVNGADRAVINSSGNVGIGTTSPSALLAVTGGAGTYVTSGGNVGIGVAAPAAQLHVVRTTNTLPARIDIAGYVDINVGTLELRDTSSFATGVGGRLVFNGASDVGAFNAVSVIQGIKENATQGNNATALTFYTQTSGATGVERVRIDSSGNVGIGTTSPGTALTVNVATGGEIGRFASGASGDAYIRVDAGSSRGYFGTNRDSNSFVGTLATTNFSLRTDNTDRVTINTSGNVGIGTTSPSAFNGATGKVTIVPGGTGNTTPGLLVGGTDANTDIGISLVNTAASGRHWQILSSGGATGIGAGNLNFYDLTTGGNGGARLSINSSGNVGIGTTSPAQLLSVSGNGYLTGGLGIGQTETTAGNITGTGRLSITSTSATSTFSTGGLTVGTSQFVVQQSSGNVGIGTTSPGSLLSVSGSSGFGLVNTGTGNTFYAYDEASDASPFVIDNAGNVGIGTTGPTEKLHVNGSGITRLLVSSSDNNPELIVRAGGGAVDPNFIFQSEGGTRIAGIGGSGGSSLVFSAGTTADVKVKLDSAGNVGIGTTSPWRTLSVVGTMAINGLSAVAGTDASVCIDATTLEVTTQAGDSCAASSARFKNSIAALPEGGLDVLSALRPVSFKYNDDISSTTYWGFIAEEAASTSPQFAYFNPDGTVQTINITALLSITVKAVQELAGKFVAFAEQVNDVAAAILGFQEEFVTKRLCLGATCITETELKTLLAGSGQSTAPASGSFSGGSSLGSSSFGTLDTADAAAGGIPAEIPAKAPEAESSLVAEAPADILVEVVQESVPPAETTADVPPTEPAPESAATAPAG